MDNVACFTQARGGAVRTLAPSCCRRWPAGWSPEWVQSFGSSLTPHLSAGQKDTSTRASESPVTRGERGSRYTERDIALEGAQRFSANYLLAAVDFNYSVQRDVLNNNVTQ